MDLSKFALGRFWAIRLFSILLKVTAVGMLIIFGLQLFGLMGLRLGGMGSFGGTIPGEYFVRNDELLNFIVQRVLLIVGTYAGGQLLTLLISVELSLRTLATRRRQTDPSATSSE